MLLIIFLNWQVSAYHMKKEHILGTLKRSSTRRSTSNQPFLKKKQQHFLRIFSIDKMIAFTYETLDISLKL